VYWQFGDGNSSNSLNPSYTYANPGTYNATLNVESINGCISTATKAVNIYAAPKASFSINNKGQCINGNTFNFTDNSSISAGSYTRAWNLGDGSTSTATNPTKNVCKFRQLHGKVNVNKYQWLQRFSRFRCVCLS
jgi:PKD repeat protein